MSADPDPTLRPDQATEPKPGEGYAARVSDTLFGRRRTDTNDRLAVAFEALLAFLRGASPAAAANGDDLIGVPEAAALYRVSEATIYKRHARGQMPPTVGGARPLLWRRRDLLASETERAVSPRRGR